MASSLLLSNGGVTGENDSQSFKTIYCASFEITTATRTFPFACATLAPPPPPAVKSIVIITLSDHKKRASLSGLVIKMPIKRCEYISISIDNSIKKISRAQWQ